MGMMAYKRWPSFLFFSSYTKDGIVPKLENIMKTIINLPSCDGELMEQSDVSVRVLEPET